MDRKELINKLIRQDIILFRKYGLIDGKKLQHEPPSFYSSLKLIYDTLSTEDIQKLLELKPTVLNLNK